MKGRTLRAAALFLAVAGGAPAAHARGASFWDRVAHPDRARAQGLIARAQEALDDRDMPVGGEAAARAESWLREALRLEPASFEATALLGDALARQRRPAEAAAAYRRARALARTPEEEAACTFEIAVGLSRAGQLAEALAEYDRHIRLGEARAMAFTNSAELLMALGRLGEAQERYREALRLEAEEQPGRARERNAALALYGLATALDRDDQPAAAREAVARALAHDPKLALLGSAAEQRGEVFFVPPADVHYYRGLALAVAGRGREAALAFERFLALAPGSRYRKRAEAHLLALAAGSAGPPVVRRRIAAAATVRADEPLSAPLVDAAWRARPDLLDGCLDSLPEPAPPRVALELLFDAAGGVANVDVPGGEPLAPFASCADGRVRAGLRLPGGGVGKTAVARIELVLAVRR